MRGREIKFRQPHLNLKGKFVDWFYWGYIDGGFISPLRHNIDDYQYTGLKDKNGTEVYGGDIYKQKGYGGNTITGVVVWYDDHSFRVREGNYIYHWVKFAGEVIGNIYENKELLNG